MADIPFISEFVGAAIISIIIISNPISTSALFISLTEGMSQREKNAIIRRTLYYSIIILVFFALTGLLLFKLFGFGLGAFRIAGGVLLLSVGIGMLNPKPSSKDAEDTANDIAIIPLAIPFTAGPGTITTVVVLVSESQNIMDTSGLYTGLICMIGVYVAILINIIVAYFMMSRSEKINSYMGEGGRKVVTRLMGLLVMAIAIQFIINGIQDILPEFLAIAGI